MKKLAFLFAAVVAVSFASCGNGTEKAECADSCCADTCEVVETVDTVAADTVAAPVAE